MTRIFMHLGMVYGTWTESGFSGESYIVFIGINLNEQQLEAEWKRWLQLDRIRTL